jgi:shikimate dehydrogenase
MADPIPFRLAGVIGWPVFQSRSPILHGFWLDRHGIAGAYVPMAVRPEALEAALRGLVALGFRGVNVTLPHKQAALRLLDRIDPVARRIGAVNLVVVEPDGTLSGFNKDGYGFLQNLQEAQPAWRADAGPAVVLGAGGGARAIVDSLVEAGAPEVRLVNRTAAHAQALAAHCGPAVTALPWSDRAAALDGAALLVNTTNQGMIGQPPLDLPLAALPRDAVVVDIVYNPLETPLLAAARARGNPAVGGLGMLLHQARPAFAAFYGVLPEVTAELHRTIAATL